MKFLSHVNLLKMSATAHNISLPPTTQIAKVVQIYSVPISILSLMSIHIMFPLAGNWIFSYGPSQALHSLQYVYTCIQFNNFHYQWILWCTNWRWTCWHLQFCFGVFRKVGEDDNNIFKIFYMCYRSKFKSLIRLKTASGWSYGNNKKPKRKLLLNLQNQYSKSIGLNLRKWKLALVLIK